MAELIAVLRIIPDVIWAAVIASLLTLGGVLLTNIGNNKRLTNQLLHDAKQRDRERSMELRRQVYLEAAEAITANHMILMKLTDMTIQDSELAQQFSDSAATLSKVNVIASVDTVKAVSELSSALGAKYLQLTAKRIPLVQRKIDIDILNSFIDKSSSEKDRMIELMKEINIQGHLDERLWGVVNNNYELEQEQIKKYSEERDQLIVLNNKELLQFIKECFRASKEVGEYFVPAIQAVREEMDIPFDKKEYKETLERSWKTAEQSLSEFIENITK